MMDEQEQPGTLIHMVTSLDLDEFAGLIEAKLADGWLMNGPWQMVDGDFTQMMVKFAQPPLSRLDELEGRLAQVEITLAQIIQRLTGGGVARTGIILPPDLKGGGRTH